MSGNHYKTDHWRKFRKAIIDRDQMTCVKCKRSQKEGAILQVHHKFYIPGLMPWEYPYDVCITVCKLCHSAEHGITPPNSGWIFLSYDDLGDLNGYCEYCNTELRHEFTIFHIDWGELKVGTVCCDKLTQTDIASNEVDFCNRLRKFLNSPKWKLEDGVYRINHKGKPIVINKINSYFKLIINWEKGKNIYPNLNAAKEQAFYVLENGLR